VSLFDALGIARTFWPRFVSVLVMSAIFFAPHLSDRLIEREAEVQAEVRNLAVEGIPLAIGRDAELEHYVPAGERVTA
jgi:hypothetical protein